MVYRDRVAVTSTTAGLVAYTLGLTPATGCRSFAVYADGDETTYCVESADRTVWEINRGIVGGNGTTLTRGTLVASSTGSPINWTAGTRTVFCCPAGEIFSNRSRTISFSFDGQGSAPAVDSKTNAIVSHVAGTITQWDIVGDVSGSAVVDIWKIAYGSALPTVADTIFGSKPTLSSAVLNQATGLSIAVAVGDIWIARVDSADTLTKLTVELKLSIS